VMVQAFLNASEDELRYFAYNGEQLVKGANVPGNQHSAFTKTIKDTLDGL